MKKIRIILFTLFLFFCITTVKAVNRPYNVNLTNDCVINKTCMLACAYTNEVPINSSTKNIFSSYIYYSFENSQFFIEWYSQETEVKYAKHTYAINNKYVFFQDDALNKLKSKGVCPNYGYIDANTMGFASETCVTNSVDFCTETSTNAGTTFKGSSSKDYDFSKHIDTYFNKWKPNITNYSCQELENQNVNFDQQILTDFSKNYLFGNTIPGFISNSASYINGMNSVKNDINKLYEKCVNEEQEKLEDGEITQEEYDETLNQLDAGKNNFLERLDKLKEEIKAGTGNDNKLPEIDSYSCDSLLGSPSKPGTPAYYLNIAFKVLRYVAIIILIVMSIIDFVQATSAQDDDALKKAISKTTKRVILCVIIFVLPILINAILNLIHFNTMDLDTCGIGGV